ncbi:MAG: protease modulator HflC [Deltaproteobacteria bacterium CG_4_8_14_3_um_filter_51_11]|nr:protease modulator HflC [bacterium]OIP39698.1 MAG: HflC protein [Desulfobacteraceae bacterium CG2_30_51_40]PIP45865.1 MAG: HflC protein [Deltaproteobacteria bacterium CG23_combo_of_CG06-09_8_20_14_all_51_20]PIW01258.1 MAG: protease modulator HflC [Deltaproteobacteria bacterium CG17_big_fil_post_rev_8_21_14_2_50_51_6]PIX18961.1 MAG: protease modulator HflC [Deltaproteobacteria bacterium CG_4_8_14_3_um_filter_51_11]PIY27096.1 MAG: protease modulator HflC [Deltaproteobacteria bacterium CG_4_10
MKSKILAGFLVIIIIGFFSGAYVVDETEQAIITQFGRAVGEAKTSPGLYFKVPLIQQANYFPKNLLQWDGDPGQIPTLDKTYIWVDTFARWKIVDPLKFFQTVNNVTSALARLDDILDAAVRNYITSYPLLETVRVTNRKLDTFEVGIGDNQEERITRNISTGRKQIIKQVQEQARPKLAEFGIQLVDVKIKRLNYVEEVQQSVYSRMIAERKQIAEKFRSEGKGEASKIAGNREKELKKITSEAYKISQEIKGKADAEAAAIYAEALGRDPQFYSFIKTLEIYKETMDKNTSLILSTDSEFLQYLKDYGYSGSNLQK